MSMRKILALLLAVVMICSLFVSPALAAEDEGIVAISDTAAPEFTDLADHWAEDAILRWAEEGIVQGYGDGTVQPAGNLKRAELATILARLLGLKAKADANTFSDVAADAWYADAVLKCAEAGIMLGDGTGRANPEATIDRQQTIVMVGRALGVKPATGHSLDRFDDGDTVADWAAPYMIALTDKGILSGLPTGEGDGAIVAPTVNIDRASTFTLLDKAIAQYITAPCTVTVSDADKFVVINSAAEEKGVVTVTGSTAGVVIAVGTTDDVVLNRASVGTLKVDAPVDVTINRGSAVTDLDANAAADVTNNGTVGNLNTNADDVIFDGNKPAKVNTAEGVEPAKDSKGKEVTAQPTTSGGGSGGGSTPSVKTADVVAAPSVDQKDNGFGDKVTDSVSVKGTEKAAGEYNVKITASGVKNHTNAASADGRWVGFGIPAVKGNSYYLGNSEITAAKDRTIEVNGKTYNTIYFSFDTEAEFKDAEKVITVQNNGEVTATYNVTFDVTFYKVAAKDVKILANEADTAAVITALEENGTPWAHKFAKGLGLEAKVSGNTVALTGTTTLEKLQNTYLGQDGNDGYLTYALQVTDAAIGDFKYGQQSNIKDELGLDGVTLVANQKIYDGSAKTLAADAAMTFELLDAAGRPQDTITVTVDASKVEIDGLKKATFKNGDEIVATILDQSSVTAPAVPENTDDIFYTGNWISGDKKVAAGATYTFGDEKEITFTADQKTVTDQTVAVRPAGPAGATADFDYQAAYTKAGITGTTAVVIDGEKMLAENAVASELLHNVNGKQYVFYGLQFTKPAEATSVVVADNVAGLANVDTVDLTTESDDVFQGQYINYINVSKALESGKVVLCGEGPATFTYAFKWMKGSEVLAVTKATVTRTTKLPMLDVTFKLDNEVVYTAKKAVAYGATEVPDTVKNAARAEIAKKYSNVTIELAEMDNYTVAVTLTTDVEKLITVTTGKTGFGADFGDKVTAETIQDITLGEKNEKGHIMVEGSLYYTEWPEFSSVQNCRAGYYAALSIAAVEGATVKYNNGEAMELTEEVPPFVTIMGGADAENFTNQGVKLEVDLDGDGPIKPATYTYNFTNVKAVRWDTRNAETGSAAVRDNDVNVEYQGNYYANFEVKGADNKQIKMSQDHVVAILKETEEGNTVQFAMEKVNEGSQTSWVPAENNTILIDEHDNDDPHDMGMTLKQGTEAASETWYFFVKETVEEKETVKCVKVTFAVPAAPAAQGNATETENTADLSAVEVEEVAAPAEFIVPADDEVAEIPVMD